MKSSDRASLKEQQRVGEMYTRAVELFDAGYSKTDDDYPGWLRGYYAGQEPIEVPYEVWFFIRGTLFGMGHASESEQLRKLRLDRQRV